MLFNAGPPLQRLPSRKTTCKTRQHVTVLTLTTRWSWLNHVYQATRSMLISGRFYRFLKKRGGGRGRCVY